MTMKPVLNFFVVLTHISNIIYGSFGFSTRNNAAKIQKHPSTSLFLSSSANIRGNRYGTSNNSTILTAEDAAQAVGVIPPLVNASKGKWKRAWKFHQFMLPILHSTERFDKFSWRFPFRKKKEKRKSEKIIITKDSYLNLACLWWKAISGNDKNSPAYDEGLAYDLLPKLSRYVVHPFIINNRILNRYPRLHHANVEIRTAFLDKILNQAIISYQEKELAISSLSEVKRKTKFRLISIGSGYDLRSVKFLSRGIVDEAYELDLPSVVQTKQCLLETRLCKRRPEFSSSDSQYDEGSESFKYFPKFREVDLNNLGHFEEILTDIVDFGKDGAEQWHNIFLFEGVMIYLDKSIPSNLLRICSEVTMKSYLGSSSSTSSENDLPLASLCLADRLENVPEGNFDMGTIELQNNGSWDIEIWLPKPGMARHQLFATLKNKD